MKILIMGGTGAMGKELVPLLAQDINNKITVTSRKTLTSNRNIEYIQGNAKNNTFLNSLLENNSFDIIVDFMLYSVDEFKDRFALLLNSCKQYIFFSSSRVYAASSSPINEDSSRLLDISSDQEYLKDSEYSLTKAKEEDILKKSEFKNCIIIRPYKTYSSGRLQLGVFEAEQWLYRAASGKTVVVPGNIEHLHTSLTYAEDTAKILKRIIGDMTLNGEVIQIANPERITWGDVTRIYSQFMEKKYGKKIKFCFLNDTSEIEAIFNNKYRIKYDGLIDRTFDDKKILALMGKDFSWTPATIGLTKCLDITLKETSLAVPSYSIEGMYDRIAGEYTSIYTITENKNRLKYLLHRMLNEKTIKKIKNLYTSKNNSNLLA